MTPKPVRGASSQRWLKTLGHFIADRSPDGATHIEAAALAACAWSEDGREHFLEVTWCAPWYVVLTSDEVWYFETLAEVEDFVETIAQFNVRANAALAALKMELRRRTA